ncbi:MAG: superoxide dismutase [Nitrospinae bacterium]|nr:superoxide dismutase [Nitrospinota bacterium]
MAYVAKTWNLDLKGLSKAQLDVHFALYQGYVTNTNRLNDTIAAMLKDGKGNTPDCAELKRRLGFEYNGMVLHEYYFDNLGATAPLAKDSALSQKIQECYGSYETWEADFKNTGLMRGIGWAIMYQDPRTKAVSNHWVGDHEVGHIAGFNPVLIMDVWEHAYTVDYKATERAKYIEAFMGNVQWDVVNHRLQ